MENAPTQRTSKGSNPNTRNAQRRKNNRPRTKNVPAEVSSSLETKWVEPLENIQPSVSNMEPIIESVPSGFFEIDPDFPSTVVNPFRTAFESIGTRNIRSEIVLTRVSNKLHAMSYFKASKQLYASMTDTERSYCQPLKVIFHDSQKLPSHMSAALGIIGHVDSKFGKIQMRDPTTIFRRWILKGLNLDPDTEYQAQDVDKVVWRNPEGYELVKRLAFSKLKEEHDVVHTLLQNVGDIRYSIPLLDESGNAQEFYNGIIADQDYTDRIRNLSSLVQMNLTDWLNANFMILSNDRRLTDALENLGLRLPTEREMDVSTSTQVSLCFGQYSMRDAPLIEGLFVTSATTANDRGHAAQFVKASGDLPVARMPLPVSDSDIAIGYTFNVNRTFEFNPRIVAYSKKLPNQAASEMAQIDVKPHII